MAFDLQVFNKQTHLALTETVDQDIEKFNQASGGVITLPSRSDTIISRGRLSCASLSLAVTTSCRSSR